MGGSQPSLAYGLGNSLIGMRLRVTGFLASGPGHGAQAPMGSSSLAKLEVRKSKLEPLS